MSVLLDKAQPWIIWRVPLGFDGSVTLEVGGALDGNYAGQGDTSDTSTCPASFGNPTNRGTLCTLFKFVAGSFQLRTSSFRWRRRIRPFSIQGKTATVYFECHSFNVATDPATGQPLWKAASHLVFDGTAQKSNGTWLFSHRNAPVTPGASASRRSQIRDQI